MINGMLCRAVVCGRVLSRNAATLARLEGRRLVEVSGTNSGQLLQGLVTNDIEQLSEDGEKCMYTHFLNVRGRIMYDSLIYWVARDRYLVEVDSKLAGSFSKFLSLYNIRSKAKIVLSENPVFACFNDCAAETTLPEGFVDPRLVELGRRIIGTPPAGLETVSSAAYDKHRVKLGVGEGARDIASGKDFPFEHNLDFLNGVSFSKGCYIGQELTARTHHVGETRKRVVPVSVRGRVDTASLPLRLNSGTRAAGKLLSVYGEHGLAVVRFPYLERELSLAGFDSVSVVGYKPSWWPQT